MENRRSPLNDEHVRLGAKMVPFGGWDMPVSYPSGTLAEHRACRTAAAMFDVSHLGTVRVEGPDGFGLLQRALTNDLSKIAPGRAQYTHLLDESDASVLDDIIVWWVDDNRFDVMPNASNTARVRDAIGGEDVTAERAVIAVQGPSARQAAASVISAAATVPRFGIERFDWKGNEGLIAGTGYTGEDGVEIAVAAGDAAAMWNALLDAGIVPAALGARDTLRLEAGLPLHGHELGPGITPLQAGLGWVVGWNKGEFRGRKALEKERDEGVDRHLVGFRMEGRQPPREGCEVFRGDEGVGAVTSGNFSPMLECGIAMGFVSPAVDFDDVVQIDVRGRRLGAKVVKPPFVKH